MRVALPKAFLFGLTGTPINRKAGKNTFYAFGSEDDEHGYMSRYGFEESIRDGATLPLHFEPRLIDLHIDKEAIDQAYAQLAGGLSDLDRDNLAKMLPGAAKYYLTQGEIVSNGAYYNALVPNLQPAQLLQPFLDYAFGFRRGVEAGQPPDNAGPRAELPFPVNSIPQPGDLPNDGNP